MLADAVQEGMIPSAPLIATLPLRQWKAQQKAKAGLCSVPSFRVCVEALIHLWTPTHSQRQTDTSEAFGKAGEPVDTSISLLHTVLIPAETRTPSGFIGN